MIENINRIGNFTSSEIVALTTTGKNIYGFGKPALTYIEECNMERRLGRSITKEESAKPLTWGKLLEKRVFELLGTQYKESAQETILHPLINYWAGSPDGLKFDEGQTVYDIKCPITLKSFCQLVDGCYMEIKGREMIDRIKDFHKDGEKYYWQLVSNAILTDSKYAELIVYAPLQSELDAIRDEVNNYNGDANKVAWVRWSQDNELPYLNDGGYYKNLNIIRFEVPQADKDFLTERVYKAGELLIEKPSSVLVTVYDEIKVQ
jgi:hypothetical protein